MRKLVLIAFIGVLTSCNAQNKITATKNQSGDLVGIANKESFKQAPYNTWFTSMFNAYQTDQATIANIKKNIKGVTVKGFMGTWCGDSKRETPRFYKVMEQVGVNEADIELVTVNRSKRTPDNLQEGLNIQRVPTFIFYKNGKEIGRYVEYARETIEKDILKIVSGQGYKHSYQR